MVPGVCTQQPGIGPRSNSWTSFPNDIFEQRTQSQSAGNGIRVRVMQKMQATSLADLVRMADAVGVSVP
jgi:hypothetical protein